MHEFVITGEQGFIRIVITDNNDCEIKGKIEIRSGNYYVKEAEVSLSTGELLVFSKQLQQVYQDSKGCAALSSTETNLQFELDCNSLGQIIVQGHFQEIPYEENILQFEFESEHHLLSSTLRDLKKIDSTWG